jgi:hypothetical protein
LLLACVVVNYIIAPLYAVITLGAGAASMGAAFTMNLTIISLVEILGVAFTEEDE